MKRESGGEKKIRDKIVIPFEDGVTQTFFLLVVDKENRGKNKTRKIRGHLLLLKYHI